MSWSMGTRVFAHFSPGRRLQLSMMPSTTSFNRRTARNGHKPMLVWAKKLAALKKKHGTTPNIIYILWDDQQVGAVGNEMIQKLLGYTTPNINQMAAEGINFTRMYSEPGCTPTRAAFITGRIPCT